MGDQVRAVLVGGGLVGQVCHLTTLTRPGSPIVLAGVVDASLSRAKGIAARFGVPAAASLEDLDLSAVDALVVAAPDPAHYAAVRAGLQAGRHVFCEKPLGLTAAECADLDALATRAGTVAQVGYMKRFDPVRARLERALAQADAHIESVAVEVRDPDAAPFVRDFPFVPAGDDVDPAMVAAGAARFHEAVSDVIGRAPTAPEATAWGSFIGALIHDLNFVRAFLPPQVTVAAGFTSMAGLQVGLHLRTADGVLARLTHTQVPHTADYQELVTFYTTAGVYEVVFPAPYLLHATTPLRHYPVKDARHEGPVVDLNDSIDEAFELEMDSFAQRILAGESTPERNSFADAVADLTILESAMRLAVGG